MIANWLCEHDSTGSLAALKIPTAENLSDLLPDFVTGGEFQTKAHAAYYRLVKGLHFILYFLFLSSFLVMVCNTRPDQAV